MLIIGPRVVWLEGGERLVSFMAMKKLASMPAHNYFEEFSLVLEIEFQCIWFFFTSYIYFEQLAHQDVLNSVFKNKILFREKKQQQLSFYAYMYVVISIYCYVHVSLIHQFVTCNNFSSPFVECVSQVCINYCFRYLERSKSKVSKVRSSRPSRFSTRAKTAPGSQCSSSIGR